MVYMDATSRPKLSVSLALQALSEASERVREAEDTLQRLRRERDELIADALAQDVKVSRVSRITGLSRQMIWKLKPGGSENE